MVKSVRPSIVPQSTQRAAKREPTHLVASLDVHAGGELGDRLRATRARPHVREVPVVGGVEHVPALTAAHTPVPSDRLIGVGLDVEPGCRFGAMALVGTGRQHGLGDIGAALELDQPGLEVVGSFHPYDVQQQCAEPLVLLATSDRACETTDRGTDESRYQENVGYREACA